MKQLLAIAVLLTMVSTASFASGPLGENSSFKLITKADTKYELIYVSSEQSDVRVSIFDKDGRNIESNTVRDATKFRRTFDFSKLEPGKYSIVVKNDEGTSREEINYLPYKMKLKTFVAKIPDTRSIKVHVGDFNSKKAVTVKIYDARDKVVHTESINNDAAFCQVFNLKMAKSNEFRIVVENDGEIKTFVHEFKE